MEYKLKKIKENEKALTYHMDNAETVGCIGHLRGDFDAGTAFHFTWWPCKASLCTREFVAEFDELMEALRNDFLSSRNALLLYCRENELPAWNLFASLYNYGLKAITENYVYYFRFAPYMGNYDVYVYAYRRKILERCQLEAMIRDYFKALLIVQKNGMNGIPTLSCPRCGEPKLHPTDCAMNAFSRYENIYICSDCGADEAFRPEPLPVSEWAVAKDLDPKHDFLEKELEVRDLEVSEDGLSIEAYVGTWFDVEEKLDLDYDLNGIEYTNLYAVYTPSTGALKMPYVIVYLDKKPDGGGVYRPSDAEKELVISLIQTACRKEGYASAETFVNIVSAK